nr:TetR/AcrR family transcriptional regulator [Hyphomonas sp. Mor2]
MATQKQRSDETRLKLLNAFRNSFLERGYAATTVKHVLDQTGLSKGALYHHFSSKEEIIEALFEHESRSTIERVMTRTDPTAPPLKRLRAACLDWTREVRAPDVSKIIFEIGPAALGARKAKEIEDRNSLHRIEALLSEAIEAGELSAADPKLIAAFLNALVAEAGLYDLRTGRDSVPTLALSIDALFEGMRP